MLRSVATCLAAVCFLAAADLEAGYAPGCTVALDLGPGPVHEARAVAVQPDGRIVIAGYVNDGIDRDFLVARFHPDLTLDTSFNGTGWRQTNFDREDEAFDLAIQPDGKIVVVGFAENNGGSKRYLALARYLPDGNIDTSFGGVGPFYIDFPGSSFEALRGVALQPDGKIVVVGYHTTSVPSEILVARFDKDGFEDTSFDADGYLDPLAGTNAEATDVAIGRNGNITVSATGTFGGFNDFVAVRIRPDGTLDPSFAGGWVATDIGNPDDDASSVAVDASDNVIVAGTSSSDFAVVRYRPDGTLDGSFDGDGIAIHDIGTDAGHAMSLDQASNIVVVGEGGSAQDFALTRFTPGGTVDLSVTHDVLNGDQLLALQIRRDGKLVTAGTTQLGANPQATVALYNADGTQDCGEIALHPESPGAASDFAPAGCASNWDCVNDQTGNAPIGPVEPHDGLTTFVTTSTPARDLYRLADPVLPVNRVVTEIQIVAQLRWSGAGASPSVELLYQRQGFDALPVPSPAVTVTNSAGFQAYSQRWTKLNWTSTELNALEIGVEHVSGDALDVTQMYVLVTYGGTLVHPVEPFTAAATGDGGGGQVTLNWLNPSYGLYDETVIRRSTTACPTSPTSDDPIVNQSDGLGQPGTFVDSVPIGPTYYYAAFVEDAQDHVSRRQCLVATPFDRTAVQVDWRYSTADPITTLATPGIRISTNSVFTATNDGVVHAMTGGSGALGGGSWPAGWKPFKLGAKAPNRPPVVQLQSGAWVALFGAEDGHVYAIDSVSGALVWRSSKLGGMISSSPAAILSAFGSAHDLVFVGTRDAGLPNRLYALNASDGTVAWYFDNGGPPNEIGIITSGPSVSYADERVYFTSFAGGATSTVWCIDFSTSSPATCGSWPGFGVATSSGGNVDASPILFSNLVFVSDQTPGEMLYAFNPTDGTELPVAFLGNGGARDYVFPQFGSLNVIASTATEVLSVDTAGPGLNWVCAVSSPSAPLSVVGSTQIYVGGDDGKLHRLNTSAPGCPGASECIGDCSTTVVGAPAYDFTKTMIYVGTDDGDIYGVKAPF